MFIPPIEHEAALVSHSAAPSSFSEAWCCQQRELVLPMTIHFEKDFGFLSG